MAKEKITAAQIQEDINGFIKKGQFNKTTLSLDWMDNYVAKFKAETLEDWAKFCAAVPKFIREKDKKAVVDVKAVREHFIKTYFPDYTDEAVEDRKAKKKAEREAQRAEKEKEKNLSLEEKLLLKLKRLKDEE